MQAGDGVDGPNANFIEKKARSRLLRLSAVVVNRLGLAARMLADTSVSPSTSISPDLNHVDITPSMMFT